MRARVLLIGEERPRELDLSGELRRLDMEESTVMTGWVEEERARWRDAIARVRSGSSTMG